MSLNTLNLEESKESSKKIVDDEKMRKGWRKRYS